MSISPRIPASRTSSHVRLTCNFWWLVDRVANTEKWRQFSEELWHCHIKNCDSQITNELAVWWRNHILRFLHLHVLWVEPVQKYRVQRASLLLADAWFVMRSGACLNVKLFVCMLCARSLKVQELSFKNKNYHVFQSEVFRTISSG